MRPVSRVGRVFYLLLADQCFEVACGARARGVGEENKKSVHCALVRHRVSAKACSVARRLRPRAGARPSAPRFGALAPHERRSSLLARCAGSHSLRVLRLRRGRLPLVRRPAPRARASTPIRCLMWSQGNWTCAVFGYGARLTTLRLGVRPLAASSSPGRGSRSWAVARIPEDGPQPPWLERASQLAGRAATAPLPPP